MTIVTRRRALTLIGATLATPALLAAQQSEGSARMRRSVWDLVFTSHPVAQPADKPDWSSWNPNTITAAWLGHASVLINMFGTWILTDPVFSHRIGIEVTFFTVGIQRLVHPALTLEDLPPLDLVLVSHAHMDHLDLPTLRRLPRDVPTIMAKHTSDLVYFTGLRRVAELDWNETIRIGGVTVEALEAKHFGWRFPWEEDRSRANPNGRSYNAFLLMKRGVSVLFGGDTAYTTLFAEKLAGRTTPLELSIMPIGAYNPWIRVHATPEQAVTMAEQMGARAIFPMHWGTFIQSDEPVPEPMQRFKRAMEGQRMVQAVERVGETWKME